MRYFFIDSLGQKDANFSITGSDARHIRTVLRLKPGDKIGLFDGKGFARARGAGNPQQLPFSCAVDQAEEPLAGIAPGENRSGDLRDRGGFSGAEGLLRGPA